VRGLSAEARQILDAPESGWSAVTLELPHLQRKAIILNQTHSARRQSSDLTHEIAHHLCEHTPAVMQVSKEGLMMLETYSRKDEEEADWLSGCLLLPRPALIHIRRRLSDEEAVLNEYAVSRAMLKYRLDVSGVNYQYRRAGANR
jgi:Zn-dependent peptidase ImmA (M78 family)